MFKVNLENIESSLFVTFTITSNFILLGINNVFVSINRFTQCLQYRDLADRGCSSSWLDLQMCGNISCSNIYLEDPFRFTARHNQDKSQTVSS